MVTATFSFFLCSCATSTYKDFKVSQVVENEGVAIGKVNIKYNGKDSNKECFVCLDSVNGPCQKLTEEGFVFLNTSKGAASIRRIACKDTSMQHYNIEGANFTQSDGVTYFGNVDIAWTNDGGFKASTMFGAVGAMISESNNDGTINMACSPGKMSEVVAAYEQQTKQTAVQATKSIVKAGK